MFFFGVVGDVVEVVSRRSVYVILFAFGAARPLAGKVARLRLGSDAGRRHQTDCDEKNRALHCSGTQRDTRLEWSWGMGHLIPGYFQRNILDSSRNYSTARIWFIAALNERYMLEVSPSEVWDVSAKRFVCNERKNFFFETATPCILHN